MGQYETCHAVEDQDAPVREEESEEWVECNTCHKGFSSKDAVYYGEPKFYDGEWLDTGYECYRCLGSNFH